MSEFLSDVGQGVPRLDPDGSHEFVETQAFLHFVAQTTRIIAATDTNPGLVHAFMGLLEMTVAASRRPVVAEILLRENLFTGLLAFKGRLVLLIELITTTFPAVAERFGEIRQRLVAKGKRPDRSKVLGAFAVRQQAFATGVQDELEAIKEQTGDLCPYCHEPIDFANQVYGVLLTGLHPPQCSHYCHMECSFHEHECPICRARGELFCPVGDNASEIFKQAALHTVHNITFMEMVVMQAQLLELYESTELSPIFRQVMRTIIRAVVHVPPADLDPLLLFARSLATASSFEDAAAGLPAKAAAIVWNCNGGQLDLASFHCELPDVFLSRVPQHYHNFFLNMNVADLKGPPGNTGTCICLKCGAFAYLKIDEINEYSVFAHAIECCPAFLVITQSHATAVISVDIEMDVTSWGGLYVTEHGDDDIGLAAGKFLVLSKQRKHEIMTEFIRGELWPLPGFIE
jgi:hypothetical protein